MSERFLIQRPLRASALLCSDFAPITARSRGREAGPTLPSLFVVVLVVSFKNKRSTSEIDFAVLPLGSLVFQVSVTDSSRSLVDYFRPLFNRSEHGAISLEQDVG